MWALCRASMRLRNRGLISLTAHICRGKLEITKCFPENYNAELFQTHKNTFDGLTSFTRFYNTSSSPSKLCGEVRTFSSQAGAVSGGEADDDLEDGFSELETPHGMAQEAASEDDNEDDLIFRSQSIEKGIADNIQNELDAFGTETDVGEKKSPKTRDISVMTRVILAAPASSMRTVLDKWVEEGNEVNQTEVSSTMVHLRKRRMFFKALQLSEWLESAKHLEFVESDYATRVDLIAKVRGVYKAEEYLEEIPESFRGEIVYRTLLANCVSVTNVKKSEKLFNKMKNLGFPTTCFSCNQMLLLYKRTDKTKIADVLLLMEEENIKPSLSNYQILIDVKGLSKDITGMEQVVETRKAEGCEPNTQIQASVARYYTVCGLKEKAEATLKEIEGNDIMKNRRVCHLLLPIYASLGREDEVDRIWKVCESDSRLHECMAAIEAWGQLNKIENAEAVFHKMLTKVKKPSSRHFNILLKVYANHAMLAKGKDLVKRMGESGCTVGPLTWDSLVNLYVRAGKVEKADSTLEKAVKQKRGRPLFSSYLTIMDSYARKGDVHKAEKIFLMMKQAGYAPRHRIYQSLLQAYINAKAPAYGFSDRMKADNISANKSLTSQLARANAFKKSAVDELLE